MKADPFSALLGQRGSNRSHELVAHLCADLPYFGDPAAATHEASLPALMDLFHDLRQKPQESADSMLLLRHMVSIHTHANGQRAFDDLVTVVESMTHGWAVASALKGQLRSWAATPSKPWPTAQDTPEATSGELQSYLAAHLGRCVSQMVLTRADAVGQTSGLLAMALQAAYVGDSLTDEEYRLVSDADQRPTDPQYRQRALDAIAGGVRQVVSRARRVNRGVAIPTTSTAVEQFETAAALVFLHDLTGSPVRS